MFPIDWDLSNLVEGTATNPQEFHLYLDGVQKKIENFSFEIPEMFGPYQEIMDSLTEAAATTACLTGQDTSDSEAVQLEARVMALYAEFNKIGIKLDEILLEMDESSFKNLVSEVGEIGFYLENRREIAKKKMSGEKENLVEELSVSGLHGLMTLYFTYMGEIEFPYGDETLNLSQLENLFSKSDRETRVNSLKALEDTLTKKETIFGQMLNNIIDVRLRTYKARGWDEYLQESLQINRIEKETVESMWKAISNGKPKLKEYLNAKAKILGLDQLSYADYRASIGDSDKTKISYDDSCKTIIDLFTKVSPIMGAYAEKAITSGWVSASASERKRAGGFCCECPIAKESRILMTYSPGFRSQGTLAHELGHAFHNEALKDTSAMCRTLPMNLAETASTMCEMMVHDNAIKSAKDDEEKMFLLDAMLTQYVSFNMDLHSRYLFDCKLHEKRQKGFVPPKELNELMVEAQKEGFGDALSSYLPHFWAYKMHFFLTDVPFYNWVYTFGFLFSLGVYEELSKTDNFEERYIALLRDTGSMSVEELGKKHLNVDLTKVDFWQGAIDKLNGDIDEFLRLASQSERSGSSL